METLLTPESQQTSMASQHIHSQSGSKPLPAAAHSKVGACLPHHQGPWVPTLSFGKEVNFTHSPRRDVSCLLPPPRAVTGQQWQAARGVYAGGTERWEHWQAFPGGSAPARDGVPHIAGGSPIRPGSPPFGHSNQS